MEQIDLKIGDKIVVTKDVKGLTKGRIYPVNDVAYQSSFASKKCKQEKWIYVSSEIYRNLQFRLSKDEYVKIK